MSVDWLELEHAVIDFRQRARGLSEFMPGERRLIEAALLAALCTLPPVRTASFRKPWYDHTIVVVSDPPHLRRKQLDRVLDRMLTGVLLDRPTFELVHADDAADELLRGER